MDVGKVSSGGSKVVSGTRTERESGGGTESERGERGQEGWGPKEIKVYGVPVHTGRRIVTTYRSGG